MSSHLCEGGAVKHRKLNRNFKYSETAVTSTAETIVLYENTPLMINVYTLYVELQYTPKPNLK